MSARLGFDGQAKGEVSPILVNNFNIRWPDEERERAIAVANRVVATATVAGRRRLERSAWYLTDGVDLAAALRGQLIPAHRRSAQADTSGLPVEEAADLFDSIPGPYQRSVMSDAAAAIGGDRRGPLGRADFLTGLRYVPPAQDDGGAAYRHHLRLRPLAEAAVCRLIVLRDHVDGPPAKWDSRCRDAARRLAEETRAKRDERAEDKARDLEVLARTTSRIAQALWAERQVRLAADISAEVATERAKRAREDALMERDYVWDDLARRCNPGRPRASVWPGPVPVPEEWLPVIPAVPQPTVDEFRVADEGRVRRAYIARDEAARNLMDAEDRLRLVKTTVRGDRQRLPKGWRDHTDVQTAWADLERCRTALEAAKAYTLRARIEEFGTDDAFEACSPRTVRARIRATMNETDAWVAGVLQLVGGPKRRGLPAMVTDWTMERAREQAQLNADMLAKTIYVMRDAAGYPLFDEDGEPIMIAADEAAASRLHGRKSRNYAICKAMQAYGEKYGYTLALITNTLPGAYHPHPSKTKAVPDLSISPIEARREIQQRNHNALALAEERGCRFIAPRSREGQNDGTPHDHIAAFVHPDDLETFCTAFEQHFPEARELLAREAENKGDATRAALLRERQARVSRGKQVACNIRLWTPAEQEADPKAAATVASYIYGYAMKSTTGSLDKKDDATRNAVWAGMLRVRRWAILGLRRGLLGDWQDVYKSRQRPVCPVLGEAWDAMQTKDWLKAFEVLDAPGTGDQPPVVRDRDWKLDRRGRRVAFPVALRANVADPSRLTEAYAIMLFDAERRFVRTTRERWAVEQSDWRGAEPFDVDEIALSESCPRPGACGARLGLEHPPDGAGPSSTAPPGRFRGGMLTYIEEMNEDA